MSPHRDAYSALIGTLILAVLIALLLLRVNPLR